MAEILCPQCGAPLEPAGVVQIDGRELGVYQCSTCTRPWEFDGISVPTALSFAVDEDGNLLDPESGQGPPPPPSQN